MRLGLGWAGNWNWNVFDVWYELMMIEERWLSRRLALRFSFFHTHMYLQSSYSACVRACVLGFATNRMQMQMMLACLL